MSLEGVPTDEMWAALTEVAPRESWRIVSNAERGGTGWSAFSGAWFVRLLQRESRPYMVVRREEGPWHTVTCHSWDPGDLRRHLRYLADKTEISIDEGDLELIASVREHMEDPEGVVPLKDLLMFAEEGGYSRAVGEIIDTINAEVKRQAKYFGPTAQLLWLRDNLRETFVLK